MLITTPTDYATFLLEFLNPKPANDFRLNDASRSEMLRPQAANSNSPRPIRSGRTGGARRFFAG